jgi:hypothetical protein
MSQANQYYLALLASHSCAFGSLFCFLKYHPKMITTVLLELPLSFAFIVKRNVFPCVTAIFTYLIQAVGVDRVKFNFPIKFYVSYFHKAIYKLLTKNTNNKTKLFNRNKCYFNELRLYLTVIFCKLIT